MYVPRRPGFTDVLEYESRLRDQTGLFVSSDAYEQTEEWHFVGDPGEPPFKDDWQNWAGSSQPDCAFLRDPIGQVMLRGAAQIPAGSHTVTEGVFAIPLDYQPTAGGYGYASGFAMIRTDGVWSDRYWDTLGGNLRFGGTINPAGSEVIVILNGITWMIGGL